MSRCVRVLSAVASLAVLSATPAAANQKGCTGRNLFADMKTAEPQRYAEVRKAADAMPNAKSVLWKIEDTENADKAPSYLFGTIHLTDDRVAKLPAAVQSAFDDSTRIAVEIEFVSGIRRRHYVRPQLGLVCPPKSGCS